VVGDDRVAVSVSRRTLRRIVLAVGALVIVAAIAIVAYLIGRANGGQEVLSPATVPPVVGLCSAQLSYAADGNASPLFCSNGEINKSAWNYFAKVNLRVMTLGPNASPGDVSAAVSADMNGSSTGPIECSAYELAAVYYGWSFGVDPTSDAITGGCPIER
jgi:hypothetical protein